MANIKVLLFDQAGVQYDVSYIEEIPLSLSFLIADVKNPDKRNTTFSKTINFNSKDVDLFFRVIWKLNNSQSSFDPRLKCKIKYYVNEVLQLDGDIQLIKVIVDPDSKQTTYQTTATGTIGNLFLSIGDKYLTDLDFSAYNHALTKANVVNSWSAADGSGYYYGLINWGQNQVNSETEYHTKHFRPQLFKREMMSKIFSTAGYTWTSAYLDSAYYKKQVIPSTTEYIQLGTAAIANSQFYARRNANQTLTATTCAYSSSWSTGFFPTVTAVAFNEDNVLPYNDAGGQYNTANGEFTVGSSNIYDLSANINFDLNFTNTLGTATNCVITTGQVYASISKWNGSSWVVIAQNGTSVAGIYASLIISNTVYITLPNYSLTAGDKYRIEVIPFILSFDLYTAGSVLITTGTTTAYCTAKTNSTYNATLVNNEITEGATLEINQCIPTEIKQIDWLMTEVKAANLYMIPNPNKVNDYIIEPRDSSFYTGNDDWSDLLDFSKDYEVLPVSELDTKRYEFWNKPDADEFNDIYYKQYQQTFGFGYTDCVSDFVKPTKKTELIYSPTPLVDNNINGLVVPKIYKNDNGIIKPMKSNIRQLYKGGVINMSYGTWTLKSSLSGDTVYNTYPFVGDCDNPYTPTLTLNWDTPHKIYYKYINATYTDNNLKNKYYSKMIKQLSDKRSCVVKAYFNLNELKVKDFSFRKIVYVAHFNSYFYIENFEYIMNTQQSTLVTMLKLQDYSAFVPSNFQPPQTDATGTDRIINGNYSNGINNTNNGTASHIVGGSGNFIAQGATNVQLTNCTNVVVQSDVTSFVAVGLSNRVITNANSNTVVNNAISPITITTNTSLDITYNERILFVDATAGNITLTWDCASMAGCKVYIVRVDGSVNTVSINDNDATVTYVGVAVPINMAIGRYDFRQLTSIGTTIYKF